MGGMTSFASQAFQILNAAGTVANMMKTYSDQSGQRDYSQAVETVSAGNQNAEQEAEQDRKEIAFSSQMAEDERRSALRRAISRQKAQYGSSGIGSTDGSSQAVLLGLFSESEEEKSKREALDQLKLSAVDNALSQAKRVNTLRLSQMKEKNKYNQYTSSLEAMQTASGVAKTIGSLLE